MVFHGGELTIVDANTCRVLGSCRTEHAGGALTSLRLMEPPQSAVRWQSGKVIKPCHVRILSGGGRVACLLDPRTIRVLDLVTGAAIATIAHDCKIDWLVRGVNALRTGQRIAYWWTPDSSGQPSWSTGAQ